MTASVSGSQIRAYVERIERLKEEQDGLTGEIKQIYAEAKAEGFDKAALGEVVAIRRKQAKNPDAFDLKNSIVGLYMNAIEEAGLPPVHAPARANASHFSESQDAHSTGEVA